MMESSRPMGKASTEGRATRWKVALLSVMTIGGGTNGVLSCLIWLVNSHASVREFAAVCLLMALYVIGIWSGIVWQSERERGKYLAKIFLFAQVPVLQSRLISFKLWAVGSYTVVFYPKSLAFDAGWYLGSDWELSLLHATPNAGIGINLLPFALVSLLWSRHKMFPVVSEANEGGRPLG
jgi:hypothetical protein